MYSGVLPFTSLGLMSSTIVNDADMNVVHDNSTFIFEYRVVLWIYDKLKHGIITLLTYEMKQRLIQKLIAKFPVDGTITLQGLVPDLFHASLHEMNKNVTINIDVIHGGQPQRWHCTWRLQLVFYTRFGFSLIESHGESPHSHLVQD